jgi:hypothetical protein
MGAEERGGDAPPKVHRGNKAQVKRKADSLVRDAGIPHSLAWQVATGALSLNEVLERLARNDKVDGLMRRFDLPKSLATQVALGQADLDQVLRKRRMEAELARSRDRSFLLEVTHGGVPVLLGLHGRRAEKGHVRGVDQYDFTFEARGSEAPETVHKLQVKWACLGDHELKVRKAHKKDGTRDADAEPVWKPQDRYGCSDKRLFGHLDDCDDIQVTLLEGDQFTGHVTWLGRWEFGMELKKGAQVVIFRHAIADVRGV